MTAPTSEIGYAATSQTASWWGSLDDEHVPELQHPTSVLVYGRMRRDAQVKSVLQAVMMPILRTTWRLDPNGSRPEVYGPLSEDLGLPVVGMDPAPKGRTKDRLSWPEHLQLALLQFTYGHMFFEPTYRYDEAGLARLRKLAPRFPRTINQINVARDGGLVSIKQAGTTQAIPVDRLVAYVHEREGGNWYGTSLLRSAYKAWLLKDPALRVWHTLADRNGTGVVVYTGAEGEDPAKGLAIAKAVRSGAESGVSLANGSTLELQGVKGELPDVEKFIRYLDEQIARAVLAHVLNLGTQTGSWALGSVLADVLTQSLQAMAGQVADTGTMHIVEDWVDLNFGPNERAPRIVFDEIGSQSAATATALKMLVDAGILYPDRPLEEAVRQMHGLPAKASPAPLPADSLDGHLRVLVSAQVLSADEAEVVPQRLGLLPQNLADAAVIDIGNAARYIGLGADPIQHGWRTQVRKALVLADDSGAEQ